MDTTGFGYLSMLLVVCCLTPPTSCICPNETDLVDRMTDFNLTVTNPSPLVGENISFNCFTGISKLNVTYTFWPSHTGQKSRNFSCRVVKNAVVMRHFGEMWTAYWSTYYSSDCILELDNLSFADSGSFQCMSFDRAGNVLISNCVSVTVFIPSTPVKSPSTILVLLITLVVVVTALVVVGSIYCTNRWRLERWKAKHDDDERRRLLDPELGKEDQDPEQTPPQSPPPSPPPHIARAVHEVEVHIQHEGSPRQLAPPASPQQQAPSPQPLLPPQPLPPDPLPEHGHVDDMVVDAEPEVSPPPHSQPRGDTQRPPTTPPSSRSSFDGEKEISNSSNGSDEPIFIADPLADPFMEDEGDRKRLLDEERQYPEQTPPPSRSPSPPPPIAHAVHVVEVRVQGKSPLIPPLPSPQQQPLPSPQQQPPSPQPLLPPQQIPPTHVQQLPHCLPEPGSEVAVQAEPEVNPPPHFQPPDASTPPLVEYVDNGPKENVEGRDGMEHVSSGDDQGQSLSQESSSSASSLGTGQSPSPVSHLSEEEHFPSLDGPQIGKKISMPSDDKESRPQTGPTSEPNDDEKSDDEGSNGPQTGQSVSFDQQSLQSVGDGQVLSSPVPNPQQTGLLLSRSLPTENRARTAFPVPSVLFTPSPAVPEPIPRLHMDTDSRLPPPSLLQSSTEQEFRSNPQTGQSPVQTGLVGSSLSSLSPHMFTRSLKTGQYALRITPLSSSLGDKTMSSTGQSLPTPPMQISPKPHNPRWAGLQKQLSASVPSSVSSVPSPPNSISSSLSTELNSESHNGGSSGPPSAASAAMSTSAPIPGHNWAVPHDRLPSNSSAASVPHPSLTKDTDSLSNVVNESQRADGCSGPPSTAAASSASDIDDQLQGVPVVPASKPVPIPHAGAPDVVSSAILVEPFSFGSLKDTEVYASPGNKDPAPH